MGLKVGAAKKDITVYEIGKGMMGYGMHFQKVEGVSEPLSVRAFVFESGGERFVWVNAEICFYTLALKDAINKKLAVDYPELGLRDDNLMLTAQHTHSATAGLSHYLLYNLVVPGFQKSIFDKAVKQTVEVIVEAISNLKEADLHYASGVFDDNLPVAFNRSINAYNRNPEVEKLAAHDWHLAVDREMKLLRIDGQDGQKIGAMNWFGVHTTSISNDNKLIHFDNKGYAAQYMEKAIAKGANKDFLSAFAQDTAGDVTPNYIWDAKKNWTRGKFKDDFESAAFNGFLQYEKAMELYKKAKRRKALEVDSIDSALMYVDFSKVEVDPEFANGLAGQFTSDAVHGVSFLTGTKEGPGAPAPLGTALKAMSNAVKVYEQNIAGFMNKQLKTAIQRKYKAQSPKDIAVESGIGKLMGTDRLKDLSIPGGIDPGIENLKKLDSLGYTKRVPWVPHIVPIQLVVMGNLAFAGLASEITTIAGRRLRNTLQKILAERGVEQVIICSYANGYNGYVTTYEEYQEQAYEGGHTVYGKWTLAAYQSKFKVLAKQLLKPKEERDYDQVTKAVIFAEEEIWYGD